MQQKEEQTGGMTKYCKHLARFRHQTRLKESGTLFGLRTRHTIDLRSHNMRSTPRSRYTARVQSQLVLELFVQAKHYCRFPKRSLESASLRKRSYFFVETIFSGKRNISDYKRRISLHGTTAPQCLYRVYKKKLVFPRENN